MLIVRPTVPEFLDTGQATKSIARIPTNPVSGEFYAIQRSPAETALRQYQNTVLRFDGTQYLVQTLRDGLRFKIDETDVIYFPSSGFIPITATGVSGSENLEPATGGSSSGLAKADIISAINESALKLEAETIDLSNTEISTNTQDIENLLGQPTDVARNAASSGTIASRLRSLQAFVEDIKAQLPSAYGFIGNRSGTVEANAPVAIARNVDRSEINLQNTGAVPLYLQRSATSSLTDAFILLPFGVYSLSGQKAEDAFWIAIEPTEGAQGQYYLEEAVNDTF